jgi:hypothetical protein
MGMISRVTAPLLLLMAAAMSADSPAILVGLIATPEGRPVRGARVVLMSESGRRHETTTNESGIYAMSCLPPGTYRLQISKPKFETLSLAALELGPGEDRSLRLKLSPSADLRASR